MRYLIVIFSCLLPACAFAQDAVNPAPTPAPARPTSVAVSSLTLQDVGPWGAAALPQGLSPIASDLWRGADPGTLALTFSKIGPDQRFPSLQALVRQAVFSGGSSPTTDASVARTRFEAASRLGPAEAAARLIFGVPRLASDTELAAIAVDAGLRAGRINDACGLVEAVSASAGMQGSVWLESRATCYALNNEPAAANLSADLAKSAGLTDTWLSRAVAAVSGPLTAPPPFRTDSGRAIALSLRANLKPPLTLTTTQDGSAISSLVNDAGFMERLAPEERSTLLFNGASRGVVAIAHLPSPVRVASPPVQVAAVAPPGSAASAEASSAGQSTVPIEPPLPPAPAQITQHMLAAQTLTARASEARRGLTHIKQVMATQPGLMTLSDVPLMTEAALWAGDGPLASAIAALSPEALDPKLALVLALYDPSKQPQSVERRLEASGADPVARRVALREAVMAWSAGVPVSGGVSNLVQQGLPWGQAGNAGLRIALDLAASRGSKGEVILLAGLALQGEDVINANPETVIVAIRSLARVGLKDGARDLARDYLLATYVNLAPRSTPARPRQVVSSAPTRADAAPRPAAAAPRPAPPRVAPTSRAPARTAPARPSPPPPAPSGKPSWGTP